MARTKKEIPDSSKKSEAAKKKFKCLKMCYKHIKNIGPFVVGVVALVLSIFALCNTQKSFEIQNRAYLFLSEPNIQNYSPGFGNDDIFFSLSADIMNNGNTLAQDVSINYTITFQDTNFIPKSPYDKIFKENLIIAPHSKFEEFSADYRWHTSKDTIRMIQQDRLIPFFYGSIIYKDIFGIEHTTFFCYHKYYLEMYNKHNEIS